MLRHAVVLCVSGFGACVVGACDEPASSGDVALDPCEWCGAQDAPRSVASVMRVAGPDEPGERLVLRGRVFAADGETPAGGVLVYAYGTDAAGVYRRDGGETGNGRRHGALRGWLRTDEEGRYEIHTIMPAPYPDRTEPAHIHVTLTPLGADEYWIDSFLFDDDPLVTGAERERSEAAGRFGHIVRLERDDEGRLVGRRDIRLRRDPS